MVHSENETSTTTRGSTHRTRDISWPVTFARGSGVLSRPRNPWEISSRAIAALTSPTCGRAFVLRVVDATLGRRGWERLGYEPLEHWVRLSLEGFRALVEAFDVVHASGKGWVFGDRPERLGLCPTHRVYLHQAGCILCHEG
jgi:hypothetical protein